MRCMGYPLSSDNNNAMLDAHLKFNLTGVARKTRSQQLSPRMQ